MLCGDRCQRLQTTLTRHRSAVEYEISQLTNDPRFDQAMGRVVDGAKCLAEPNVCDCITAVKQCP